MNIFTKCIVLKKKLHIIHDLFYTNSGLEHDTFELLQTISGTELVKPLNFHLINL